MSWPARDGDHMPRRPVERPEPIVAVLLRDLEARRHKQQLEFRREIDMAGEIGNEPVGSAFVESVVDQAYVGALHMGIVRSGCASQQSRILFLAPAGSIDVQIDERPWSGALGFGQRREVRHADIENEDAAGTEQTKRGRLGVTPIIEREQM